MQTTATTNYVSLVLRANILCGWPQPVVWLLTCWAQNSYTCYLCPEKCSCNFES